MVFIQFESYGKNKQNYFFKETGMDKKLAIVLNCYSGCPLLNNFELEQK